MSVMDDAIEDGVGDGRLADHFVPCRHGELGSDQSGFPAVTFFEDFQEVETLLIIEAVRAPVVENEQLDACKFVDHAWEATVEARECKIFEQARHAQI